MCVCVLKVVAGTRGENVYMKLLIGFKKKKHVAKNCEVSIGNYLKKNQKKK